MAERSAGPVIMTVAVVALLARWSTEVWWWVGLSGVGWSGWGWEARSRAVQAEAGVCVDGVCVGFPSEGRVQHGVDGWPSPIRPTITTRCLLI